MPLETTAALRVDMLDPGAPQIIHAVQDDSDSRKIAFSIYAGGAQWAVPDGTLVTVRYKKPDGTAGFYDTLPDGSTPAATIDGNVVTVALVPQAFTVRGNVPVQIKLYNSAAASIATFAIVMHVSANVVSDAEIVSSDYYNVLTKQIADVLAAAEGIEGNVAAAQAAARQAASSASAAAGSATAAAGSASTATTAAGQAQTAATNAGQSETNAANSASDAEDAKTAAETAAGSASDDAAAAENAKTAAETAATNAQGSAHSAAESAASIDVEQGSFTPTLIDRASGEEASYTFGSRVGSYLKIGKLVFFTLAFTGVSGISQTTSQKAGVGGLPFAASTAAEYGCVLSKFYDLFAGVASDDTLTASIEAGRSYVSFWTTRGGNSARFSQSRDNGMVVVSGSYIID